MDFISYFEGKKLFMMQTVPLNNWSKDRATYRICIVVHIGVKIQSVNGY